MKIDPNSSVPIFKQIVAAMQSAIAAGVYREGESIPSAREISLRVGVNPNTVKKAFEELDSLGVIETHRGLGKFVTKGAGKSAAVNSLEEIEQTFQDGIRKAFDSGMPPSEIERIFRAAMRDTTVSQSNSQSKSVKGERA